MRTTARLLAGPAPAAACVGAAAGSSARAADPGTLALTPSSTTAGASVTASTTACGRRGHGTGDAGSLGAERFDLAPGAGEGAAAAAAAAAGGFTVPEDTEPGTYTVSVLCDNGSKAYGDLVVRAHGHEPSGHVKTGVGGSVGPDITQITAGAAVLAAAAVGGTWLLRRRASGAQG
ncbi:hypothetical protein SSP531S_15680 [Streptomyces spongiicola]|uniref:Sortase n=1 Tax=Streptomyces spongiicola TaxID=1690221 RepID=A0A388SU51_9ACTN|nr:hypothetical protein [Streptomyces spongiicola]GBQ00158.1 hypothetical protein SSP531S_15680 [Streptomyces spongiicola]